jgi:putative thioredoxin
MDFNQEVLEASNRLPVVVDFWAPWCGPCQFLGPIIEELASKAHGQWELVKVNTDEYPEISKEYNIQGIPAVKMFYEGEVMAEFTGALPKHQIERWLEQNIPDSRKKEYDEILQRILSEESSDTIKLKDFIEQNPDFLEGRVELARLTALKNPLESAELVKDIKPGSTYYELVSHINILEKLFSSNFRGSENLTDKMYLSQNGLKAGNLDQTLDNLIQIVAIDKNYYDELPRKSVIAIFNLLGTKHDLTLKYRKTFDMALY